MPSQRNVPVQLGREEALGGPLEPVMDLARGPVVSNVRVSGGSSDPTSSTACVDTVSFDVQNITPAVANTLRRVMMTEVPTMAIDRVLILENEGVVLDEILSHRLGLVPINAPVAFFDYLTSDSGCTFDLPDPKKALLFELKVTAPKDQPITPVYSGQLRFVPLPGQESIAPHVKIVHPDILLAKLGPGQRIDLKAFALKGLGLTHAKWSPVSACFYDMKTNISFSRVVAGDEAHALKKACPAKVFDIEDSGVVYAKRPAKCTMCRECLRGEYSFGDAVVIQKSIDHFHFTVESVGHYHAADIVREGLRLFADRLRSLKEMVRTAAVQVSGAAQRVQQV